MAMKNYVCHLFQLKTAYSPIQIFIYIRLIYWQYEHLSLHSTEWPGNM